MFNEKGRDGCMLMRWLRWRKSLMEIWRPAIHEHVSLAWTGLAMSHAESQHRWHSSSFSSINNAMPRLFSFQSWGIHRTKASDLSALTSRSAFRRLWGQDQLAAKLAVTYLCRFVGEYVLFVPTKTSSASTRPLGRKQASVIYHFTKGHPRRGHGTFDEQLNTSRLRSNGEWDNQTSTITIESCWSYDIS